MILRRFLFRNFLLVHRLDQWTKRRFTHTGMVFLGLFVLAAVFGINTRATHSYQLALLAMSVLAVGALGAVFFRPRIELVRRLPRFATAGDPVHYTVLLNNRGKKVERGLLMRDVIAGAPPEPGAFAVPGEPAEAKRNAFDRYVGYPRWAGLMRRRRGADNEETALPNLMPGEWTEARLKLLPLRRGFIRIRGALIARPDPLGVFKALARAGAPESLLVLPRRYAVSWAELLGRSEDRPGGQSQSASTGGAEEFSSLREYRPGDPLRHIHWKGWARLGEPVVREFHEECFVRQGLILDTFLPPGAGEARFEEAVSVAASFAGAAPAGIGTLELMFAGAEVIQVQSGQGPGAADRLLEALACVESTPRQSFLCLEQAVIARAQELSACVCVFLDYDAPRRDLVSKLKSWGVPLLVLVVEEGEADAERDPGPMSDCPHRFRRLKVNRVQSDLAAVGSLPGEPAAERTG